MILEITQIILGIIFFMFLPGWFIVQSFFQDLGKMEKILFSIIISVMLGLVVGVFFGYDRNWAQITGGFTEGSIWLGEIIITIIAGIIYLVSRKVNKNKEPPKENEPKKQVE